MKARHKRFVLLAVGMAGLGLAAWLVFSALGSKFSYFFYPTAVVNGEVPAGAVFDLGGLVKPGSLERGKGLEVRFIVTDNVHDVAVIYKGILPDLFGEGQGVIAKDGYLQPDGVFVAKQVLAKHDENYMPPEVAEALKKAQDQAKKQGVTAPGAEADKP